MCGASLCLLGEDSETTISMEDLPLRLLLRAQELYHALEEVRKFNLPDDDDSSAASCSGTSDRMGSTGIKPSFISSRLSKIISTMKVLQNDNEILRQGHTAFDKQRAFLMQDTDALRLMYTNEKKQLEEALSGTKEQLRERGAELEEVQRQSALLQELYDKACGDCERMEQELDSMRGTLGNIQQSFTGAESAAKVVHNTSVDLLDSICVMQRRLLGTAPALSASTSDAPHVQPGSETPDKGVKQLFHEGGLEMDASVEPKNGDETLPQLLADSSRCLVLCKEPLQQLWHSCGVVPVMFEWVKQYCLYAKNYLRDGEEEIRALMRTRFRETEDLLRDKSRVSQRYREVQQELDNVHVQWRERLQCVEAVHREHTEVLNRRLAAMWDLSTQHDVLRAERSRWESCAEAAEKEASRLRELLRLAELKSGDRCVSVKQARPTRDVASLTEFGILEVGYESAPPTKRLASRTDEETTQLLKQLSDALAYAKHQADDASRCRALMQDQLLLLDGGRTSVGQPQLPIRKLIEAHRERIESFIKEHGRLVGDWLSAQNDISRLKQLALEREQERQNEAEELRSRIKELRTLVQRKLEMDMITERQMMDAEHLIDRQFEEMCHRASSGLTVMQNLQDLRGALLARIRMQRNTQASFGRDAAFAGAL
ncbi:unnamed protein product [Trypanosoma congolense IL3000]|uniref:WGS project CAEQ00000000 data, annotated contig 504 n=1 Tax=Trypanosoma congolense (strain IL3000) TaxID=1068625 RepID=F9WGI2_TRYCI|nr:unnamed protein product [Trypanosoma congolense IL3000]